MTEEYFKYLSRRGILGKIYRKFFLYPKLNRYLKGKMLDVGCGIGDMLEYRAHSIGVDINEFNVAFCKQRNLDVYQMQPNFLPFEDRSYDSVLLDNVLEHISDPVPLLNEIKRVMRPDAVLLIGVPGLCGQLSDLDHKVYYDEGKLISLAGSLGFEVMSMMYTPLWKSTLLSRIVRQYCIYSQWKLKSQ